MSDPNKWLGLLKWSMKYQDGTTPSNYNKMTEEDKKWLETVMNECVIDEVERMTQIIRILNGEHPHIVFNKINNTNQNTITNGENNNNNNNDNNSDNQPTENKIHTKEELEEYIDVLLNELLTRIDQIDNAQTFVKIRGLPSLLKQMKSNRMSTRCLAADVIATIIQNNPFCQEKALQQGVLTAFNELANNIDIQSKVKAILGFSCLIRGNKEAENIFINQKDINALKILKDALSDPLNDSKLIRKSLFFLRFLISSNSIEIIYKMDFYPNSLIQLIGHDDIDIRESCLEALIEFSNYGDKYVSSIQKHKEILDHKLKERKKIIGKSENENTEIEYQLILKLENICC